MNRKTLSSLVLVVLIGYGASRKSPVLPQRPKFQEMLHATLARPSSQSIGHALDAGLVVFESVRRASAWLKGIKERTTKKEEYLYDKPKESPLRNRTELTRLMDEIEICHPYEQPHQQCHSRCMPHKYYRFCWVSRRLEDGPWSPCTCVIRRSVKQYLIVIKEELLRKFKRLQNLHNRVLSPLEVALVVFAALSLLTILVVAMFWCRSRQALNLHRRLAEVQSASRAASFRAARRASCAISRHLPKASKPAPPEASVQIIDAGNDAEIN